MRFDSEQKFTDGPISSAAVFKQYLRTYLKGSGQPGWFCSRPPCVWTGWNSSFGKKYRPRWDGKKVEARCLGPVSSSAETLFIFSGDSDNLQMQLHLRCY